MATKTQRYDHPHYLVHQMLPVQVKAVAAATVALRIPFPYATTIKSISAVVNIAGTNDVAGWDILNGTTSVGAITAGTQTAASVLTQQVADIEIAAGDVLALKTKATSATLAGDFLIEIRPTPLGAISL